MSIENLQNLLDSYLVEKSLAWSPSTFKTERAALSPVLPHLNGDPKKLWDFLSSSQKPYTISVTFGRVIRFFDFILSQTKGTINPYREFKKTNARLFKHVYVRKSVNMTFKEALKLIQSIQDESVKNKALHLLRNGLRYSESFTETDGLIVGKGGKTRKVMLPGNPEYTGGYTKFIRALKKLGLTPHMLRKIAATEYARRGMQEADLLKVFGWESMETAKYYLQPRKDSELVELMKQA